MIVVPFIDSHLNGFVVHEWQRSIQEHISDNLSNFLLSSDSWTGIVNGKPIIISGVINVSRSRYVAWALLSKDSGKHMLAATREVKKYLDQKNFDRVEILVDNEFNLGHRWAAMLGFQNETPHGMINYGDGGETYCLYSRVKNG